MLEVLVGEAAVSKPEPAATESPAAEVAMSATSPVGFLQPAPEHRHTREPAFDRAENSQRNQRHGNGHPQRPVRVGNGAWGLVRASNTGPVLVMRFEAHDPAELLKIRTDVEEVVATERAKLK